MKDKIKNPKFYFFSDDIDWCRKNFNFLDEREKFFVDEKKRTEEFFKEFKENLKKEN